MDNSFNSSLYFKDEKEMLQSIKNFLNRPDIKNCGDTISFYHLYKMVKEYMSIVNKKANDNQSLVRAINLARPYSVDYNGNSNNINVTNISVMLDGNLDSTAKIFFGFNGKTNISALMHNYLCKDSDSNNLYWEREYPALNSDILTRFYDDIMNLFDFREQYISSLMSDNVYLSKYGNNFSTSIQTGYFKASIDIDQYGNLFHYVELDIPEHLINNVDKDMVIRDYIANKEKSIMKKIPVDINSLDDVFKNILTNKSKNILIKKKLYK